MDSFFSSTPSDFVLKPFGKVHLFFIALALLGIKILIKRRNNLKDNEKVRKVLVYTLLLQQIILYAWYMLSGYFSIQESLPFYNCRIAIISIVIGELFNKEKIKYIGIYWGFMGSIIALLNPVLDPFGYSHYTFYSFFIGHLFLLWGSLYLILIEEKTINKKSFQSIRKFSNLYHLVILVFNRKYQANYCYLISPPIFTGPASRLPNTIYSVIIILLFDLALYLTHIVLIKLIEKLDNRNNFIEELK